MSDWRDGYDDWKLRSPDWDDDPCAEVRAEMGQEVRELEEQIRDLHSLIKTLINNDPNDDAADGIIVLDVWRRDARRLLHLPDPSAPAEEEIAF
jgi:hypothetical protein